MCLFVSLYNGKYVEKRIEEERQGEGGEGEGGLLEKRITSSRRWDDSRGRENACGRSDGSRGIRLKRAEGPDRLTFRT